VSAHCRSEALAPRSAQREGRLTGALAAFALALGVACSGAAHAQIVPAARVNGTPIPMSVLDRQYEELLAARRLQVARMQDPAKAKAIKREALDQLIRIELLWQEARRAGLAASEDEVQRAVAEVRGRFRNEEAFRRRIEQIGFDEAGFRDHTRKLLSGERYAQSVVDREVRIGEQDIEGFYAVNSQLFKRPAQVRVRQILVAVPADASAEQKVQARQRAAGLRARALAGDSFDELARRHSDDVTRQWGGEMDPFGRGEKAKPFEDAAFALATGAVSDLVETAAGWHVIRMEQHIAEVVVPLATARERIREQLLRMRGNDALAREVDQLRALAKVEVLTPL
jgi:parvulin-like peptidyl-prolyl isomerase